MKILASSGAPLPYRFGRTSGPTRFGTARATAFSSTPRKEFRLNSQYVPLEDSIKISRLKIRNLSARSRHLSVTAYVEWVLGTSRGGSAPFVVTEIDSDTC